MVYFFHSCDKILKVRLGEKMKVVILAGGFGTRISEESQFKPKPMIEVGNMPILWHIMKSYSCYGFNDFIICCGYKGFVIKEYFANYYLHHSDVTFDFCNQNNMTIHNNIAEPWKVTLVDTGLNTMTGGRVKRVEKYIGGETFMMTYGDGVCDVDPNNILKFHRQKGKVATLTVIQPSARFGMIDFDSEDNVTSFAEKPSSDSDWINGGFMVLEPEIFDYLEGDDTIFERSPLERLSREGKLCAYRHTGFWQCMDTLRDKLYLEELIQKNKAPWMVW